MAVRKRSKRKVKAKRKKKTPVRKAAARKRVAKVGKKSKKKTKKKTKKKAPARRASAKPKKARPAARPRAKRKPASTPERPAAAKTARPARRPAVKQTQAQAPPQKPVAPGERVGVVTHYFSHLAVAIVRLEAGTLRIGDRIHVRGHTTDFSQRVESLEIERAPVTEVRPNDEFGLKVAAHAREHDVVYKVRP